MTVTSNSRVLYSSNVHQCILLVVANCRFCKNGVQTESPHSEVPRPFSPTIGDAMTSLLRLPLKLLNLPFHLCLDLLLSVTIATISLPVHPGATPHRCLPDCRDYRYHQPGCCRSTCCSSALLSAVVFTAIELTVFYHCCVFNHGLCVGLSPPLHLL